MTTSLIYGVDYKHFVRILSQRLYVSDECIQNHEPRIRCLDNYEKFTNIDNIFFRLVLRMYESSTRHMLFRIMTNNVLYQSVTRCEPTL